DGGGAAVGIERHQPLDLFPEVVGDLDLGGIRNRRGVAHPLAGSNPVRRRRALRYPIDIRNAPIVRVVHRSIPPRIGSSIAMPAIRSAISRPSAMCRSD